MEFRIGMRQALLLLSTGTLVVYCVLVFVICQCFLSSYYMAEVETELIDAYEVVCAHPDGDWETMSELESNNLSLLLINKETGKVIYYSRYKPEHFDPMVAVIAQNIVETLEGIDESYYITTMDDTQRSATGKQLYYGRTVCLGGDTGEIYVQITTPLEAIERSSAIAMQFMVLVGVMIMFITAIIVMFLSDYITKPVAEMTNVAGQIARHNFKERCQGGSIQELRALASNINSISDQMQDYIRELEEANDRLKADLEQMEKSEQARKNLVSNISHDLKTPIALISGYADGLRSGMARTQEQVREYCDIISDEADRMMDMICRMLEVSRLESGAVQVTMDDFDLSEELDGLLSSFRVEIERRGIQLQREYPESVYVRSDALCVEQVLMNYIQNAVSHMGAENQMRVTVTGTERLRVTVFNSSPEIPQEELERIWDTFYRGEKSRTRTSRQSGLGLAIVRGNMELLGLPYGVRNVQNGVEFWAEFPASPFEQELENV